MVTNLKDFIATITIVEPFLLFAQHKTLNYTHAYLVLSEIKKITEELIYFDNMKNAGKTRMTTGFCTYKLRRYHGKDFLNATLHADFNIPISQINEAEVPSAPINALLFEKDIFEAMHRAVTSFTELDVLVERLMKNEPNEEKRKLLEKALAKIALIQQKITELEYTLIRNYFQSLHSLEDFIGEKKNAEG